MPAHNQTGTVETGMGNNREHDHCIHSHLSPSQQRGIANKGPFSGGRRGSGHHQKTTTKQQH